MEKEEKEEKEEIYEDRYGLENNLCFLELEIRKIIINIDLYTTIL